MKLNLALLAAVCALVLSAASWLLPKPGHFAARRLATATNPVGPVAPEEGLPCEGEGAVVDLRELMEKRVNPLMTSISYGLHHGGDPDSLESVASSAAALVGCTHSASAFRPKIPLARLPDYFQMMDTMRTHAHAITVVAQEGDLDGAKHWFLHLKNDCIACHVALRGVAAGESDEAARTP